MPVSIRESEIRRLVRFYRKSVKDMADQIQRIDFDRPRMFVQFQQTMNILDELDERTTRWARRNIAGLYRAASREAERDMRRIGLGNIEKSRTNAFAVINDQSIRALLMDPVVGLLPALGVATQEIRNRMRAIQNQARLMLSRQRFFDETIARVGFLEGQSLNTVRDRLVDDMVKFSKRSKELGYFTRKAKELSPQEVVSNVANLPYVKVPDPRAKVGYKRVRVDRYAEMIARTKTAQAANTARRIAALKFGQQLMQISKNKPLQNDACYLFIGKVFALTEAAAKELKIPHIKETPNGGIPFHPNCTHNENIYVPEFRDEAENAIAFYPPPRWALNKPWKEVQKEYERRGGAKLIPKLNQMAVKYGHTTGGRERRGTKDEF